MADSRLINGFRIFGFRDKGSLLEEIRGKHTVLVAMNAEKILSKDDRLRAIVNAGIGYTDGIGAVLALRKKGLQSAKIAGAEFWLDIVRCWSGEKSFYLVGATQEVVDSTVAKLVKEYPGIDIKNWRSGFMSGEDVVALKMDLVRRRPDVVFVAMGSPRQEYVMSDLLEVYPAVYMGLGGSFDVYCGLKRRAPKAFQRMGLEWLYRLMIEPTRVRRQVALLVFVWRLICGRL